MIGPLNKIWCKPQSFLCRIHVSDPKCHGYPGLIFFEIAKLKIRKFSESSKILRLTYCLGLLLVIITWDFLLKILPTNLFYHQHLETIIILNSPSSLSPSFRYSRFNFMFDMKRKRNLIHNKIESFEKWNDEFDFWKMEKWFFENDFFPLWTSRV